MRRDRKYILCIMMMVLLLSGFQNVVFAETDGVEQVESVFLETPIVTVSNVTDTGKPKLTWNEIPGADCYAVYRAFSVDGNYEQKAIVSESSWTHSGAVAGIGYFYKVQALSTGEPETNSAFSDAQFGICNFKRPVCKVDLNKTGKPVLTWKAVQNAKGYEVYSAMAQDGSYKRIATVTTNTYTHEAAKYHKNYFYKIKAIDEEKPQASSAESKVCVIYTIDLRKKLVALTFDDGPGPYTKQIVNCLRKHDGRATFFLLGQRVNSYQTTVKAIYDGGNEIGNHSYTHPVLSNLNGKQVQSQVKRTDNAIKKITGETPTLIRPPYGAIDTIVAKNVGKPMVLWNVDTLDWQTRSKKATVNHVMKTVSDGDIILMHDIYKPTMQAAIELIPKLKKKGYELVTVSELAKYRGIKMKNGKRYYSF